SDPHGTTSEVAGGDLSLEDNQASSQSTDSSSELWPLIRSDVTKADEVELRINEILTQMTLEQKVAQMIQPEIGDFTVEDMRRYGFGSYLNGGGSFPNKNKHSTPANWIALAESMYQASIDDSLDGSTIPTMWGTDAVHGHNNVIGATLFPHNIGLGATRNPNLIKRIAQATAKEVMVTGIDWVFAPTVAVAQDDRWGRTYESYSEDPEVVRQYSSAIVKGLQGVANEDLFGPESVIATVKHFIGDGGTTKGDDQGNTEITEVELFKFHAQGYVGGLQAGAQTVMASFNSWNGKKSHGSHYLLTEVLKNKMGFDGLVVGDWNGHGQVKNCSNQSCPQAVNAGLDIYMVPTDAWKPLLENTIEQVKRGEIPIERINDAVSRILRVKLRAGLFDKASPAERPLSAKTEWIGHHSHREIARQAVRESLILLKNTQGLLPLSPTQKILVAGDGADNIGKQSGGWSITWQGTGNLNQDFPGATSIFQGIKSQVEKAGGSVELAPDGSFSQRPDIAIVVFGEDPYAEGNGDLDNLEFQRGNKTALKLLTRLKAQNIPIVSIFISGRPLWINAELNASDAFVVAWLPGTEGQGVAEVIFAEKDGTTHHDFKGTLPFSWPATSTQNASINDPDDKPLFSLGFGMKYGDTNAIKYPLDETNQLQDKALNNIDLFKFPWRASVEFNQQRKLIYSSHFANQYITYQTADRRVQEDARKIEFQGKANTAFDINDNFPYDLRGYFEADAAISFDFQVSTPPTKPVYFTMRCEQECEPAMDISHVFGSAPLNRWQRLSIGVSCFANKGATMDKIVSPFMIETKGKFALIISDVKIVPYANKDASIRCAKD
ncbi:MAG: exo 1,3/1,4-beta-D-glucan glucohydrolase, partial [Kangiellaceae bacterium]|nr:exo 1,3/1,4-beta-D-glucan glucohydrolase [Kangiellaceae bacterium]